MTAYRLKVRSGPPKQEPLDSHVRRRAIDMKDRKEVNPLIEYLNRVFADLKEESGQTMAEYAVVLGVITIAVVATLTLLSGTISTVLNNVITKM
jgi:Flp pilus assembly pilin Flp